jgi:hypothetical protein
MLMTRGSVCRDDMFACRYKSWVAREDKFFISTDKAMSYNMQIQDADSDSSSSISSSFSSPAISRESSSSSSSPPCTSALDLHKDDTASSIVHALSVSLRRPLGSMLSACLTLCILRMQPPICSSHLPLYRAHPRPGTHTSSRTLRRPRRASQFSISRLSSRHSLSPMLLLLLPLSAH